MYVDVAFDAAFASGYGEFHEELPWAFVQQSIDWATVIGRYGCGFYRYFLTARKDYQNHILGALPIYITQGPKPLVANSVPLYGPLGGVCCRPELDKKTKQEVYRRLLLKAKDQVFNIKKAGALTIITNPIDPDLDLYLDINGFEPQYIFHNFTQYIEISKLFSNGQLVLEHGDYRRKIASRVRRARENGLYLETPTLSEAQLQEWYKVHEKRHIEIGAKPIPYEFFRLMFRDLKNSVLYLVYHKDTIIGGLYVIYHKEIADAFMLSFDSDYKDLFPNYFVVFHALKKLQKKGIKIFNWQSSQSRESGVYQFKKQWGSVDSEYCFLTWCSDPEPFFEKGLEKVKADYAGSYVLPFGAFEEPEKQHFYKGK